MAMVMIVRIGVGYDEDAEVVVMIVNVEGDCDDDVKDGNRAAGDNCVDEVDGRNYENRGDESDEEDNVGGP